MSSSSGWYFTEEQLSNSPSRKCGMTAEQELAQRQRAANLIQEMGQRLQVSQLCINTGIVYMHRFYAFHSFTMFHRNGIAAAAFFLAAKVEEQPRKLDHVIKILNICLEKTEVSREMLPEHTQELVFHENILLQTLGFDVAIDHPHTHVVRACQLFNIVTVSRELRQTCYFMASNSLHLTTMCLKYRPTVVAAFCIYIACKWSRWDIPDSSEGKPWYSYVDETVTLDTLKKLTDEYLQILDRSPSKFKNKMKSITNGQGNSSSRDDASTSGQSKHDKHHHHHHRSSSNTGGSSSSSSSSNNNRKPEVPASKSQIVMPMPVPSSSYKNQPQFPQPSSSSSSSQRQSSSSSSSSSRPPYPTNESSSNSQKTDERSMHRHQQESSSSYPSISRSMDPMKQQSRMSSSHTATSSSSSLSQQQQQQLSHPHMKSSSSSNLDQRHSMSSKTPVDYQLQNKKPSSAIDYQSNRSSSSSSLAPPTHPSHQQQHQNLLKKPSWQSQQPQQQQPQLQQNKPQQGLHSSQTSSSLSSHQQNLNASQSSNNVHRANATQQQHLPPSYMDQQSNKSHQQQQPTINNDFWFNDNSQTQQNIKSMNSIKQDVVKKSIFSPSPNHEPAGADKMMMMSSTNIKRESPKSEKSDRRSSTPSKKDKRSLDGSSMSSKSSSSQDKNKHLSGLPSGLLDSKKRPYITADIDNHENRDSKMRKLDMKPTDIPLSKSQPIETNPDLIKSVIAECFTNNKFDSNGDSPDVTTPDNSGNIHSMAPLAPSPLISTLPNQLLQQKQSLVDHLSMKHETMDNGNIDDSSSGHKKHSKSKKKKDKHKKKKKSHKSDREDSEREAAPLKLLIAKDKSDSKSSPESQQTTGSLKIKIPINKTDFVNNPPPVNAAPLKLKISKDKLFNNSFGDGISGGGTSSSSSSSHKKKDKDKDKHRKSKHNNNNSDGYPMTLHQQQQYQIGKMDPTNSMLMPQQSSMQFPVVDLQQQLLINQQLMHLQQKH